MNTVGLRRASSHTPADPSSGRIPGLDGLRAIAVVAVLVFHVWPSALPGGFLGVDVFFVISGFLITTLLLRERVSTEGTDLKYESLDVVGFGERFGPPHGEPSA